MNSFTRALSFTFVFLVACSAVSLDEGGKLGKIDRNLGSLEVDTPQAATLSDASDRVVFTVSTPASAHLTLEITRRGSSRGLKTELAVSEGRRTIASDSDSGYGGLSKVENVPGGDYKITVSAHADNTVFPGDFTIVLSCEGCDGGMPATDLPNDLHWMRNSAERDAIGRTIYAAAGARLQARADEGTLPTNFAVVLDADETVLDNSTFQKELIESGNGYNYLKWEAWVRRQQAPAIAGAADFLDLVKSLGGTVAIVTNRAENLCDDTRANLRGENLQADIVLCRTTTGEKEARWESIEDGSAGPLPAMDIVMYFGDNIKDFPNLTQRSRVGSHPFGERYFVLPNPMYGSWERNAMN